MRKYQQQLLLTMVRSIEEEQAKGGYSDCKKAANFVNNVICKAVGETSQTSELLDEYCELIDKVIRNEAGNKTLKKQIIKIENSIRSEFKPDRIEVAFLPYSPSMWDSLESIYLAAKDDPQCDAYVIPIPYYELNPDETFSELRYDGDKFPEDLPVVNWQEYDVEEYHPDIIFTHYAYDDNTSNFNIHPNFYGSRLKEHCELLVHVPYFVEIEPYITEYYGQLPGVLNADFVIVQSEYVKQAYIKQYNDYIRENDLGNIYGKARDKFVAIGSPKFDKILNSKKEDFELPVEWQSLINKQDGTQKKIVLYNTHTWTLIKSGDKYLNKMRAVFELASNRDDVVLWWRPHPNTEINIKTIRPEMLNVYQKIVNEYISSGIGIFDNTPDLHRAIAWSDMYYGDWSSLVTLYHITGKPVMIQDIDFLKQKEKHPLFTCVCDDGQNLWTIERSINALVKINKTTMKPEYIGELPYDDYSLVFAHVTMYHRPAIVNKKIYFPPMYAKNICVYSIDDNSFKTISFNNEDKFDVEKSFVRAVSYKEYVFFTPFMYPAILRLNTITNDIEYFSDWVLPLEDFSNDKDDPYFLNPICVGESIMLAAYYANIVVEFNMATQKTTIHTVGKQGACYNGICFDGENYWLSPRHNAPITKWNMETGEVREYDVLEDNEDIIPLPFRPVIYCGNYVWLIPNTAKHAYKINVHTEEISVVDEFEPSCEEESNPGTYYHCVFTSGDSIYAYNANNGSMIEYNCKSNKCSNSIICNPPEISEKMLLIDHEILKTERDCYYYENEYIGLGDLLKCMTNQHNADKNNAIAEKRIEIALQTFIHTNGSAGSEIYTRYKNEILG